MTHLAHTNRVLVLMSKHILGAWCASQRLGFAQFDLQVIDTDVEFKAHPSLAFVTTEWHPPQPPWWDES